MARQWTYQRLAKLNDDDLLEYLQQGHHDALAVLFDRYHRLFYTIASKILRDVGEAEDATQTAFLDIFRSVKQFDRTKGSAKSWILQYAYHRSLNRKHYLKVRRFYDRQDTTGVEVSQFFNPNGLNPQESAELVHQGLSQLSEAQRTTLQLAFFEGLTMPDIARRMEQTLGNVRHYYYRGLGKLRAFLSARPEAHHCSSEPRRELIDVKS
jgi:RNA polymerase sigma-70 factor (ECF subfamily)